MRYLPFFVLLFWAILVGNLSAQSFEKGAIILTNGDTLLGFIQNNEYEKLAYQVVFKNDRKSDPTIFRPDEIKAFIFKDGDYFESFGVSFDMKTPNGWQHVSGQRFLFRLEKGDMELFELRGSDQQPLFIRKNNGELQLLCEGKDGQLFYQAVLMEAFSDCGQMKIPDHIDLTDATIRLMVEDYNDCGSLGDWQVVPFMQAWGFVGITLPALMDRYKGYNKGASFEIRPFQNGFGRLWSMGVDGQSLIYRQHDGGWDFSNIRIWEVTAKMRFFLPVKKSPALPYGFIASKHRWYNWERYSQNPDGYRYHEEYRSWTSSNIQVGLGVHTQLKRHIFRLEFPLDSEVEMRLGYGYVIR